MALIDRDELATWLQTDLAFPVADQACAMATGIIVGHTRQNIETDGYTHTLPVAPAGTVTLPQRPVTAVEQVEVDGAALPAAAWSWDQVSPKITVSTALAGAAVTVHYTAGYDPVPGVVKAVALAVAGRAVTNPRGVRSEQVGDYSVTYAGADDIVSSAVLTRHEKALLDRAISRRAGTLRLA